MRNVITHDDDLDTCYHMTSPAPRASVMPTAATLLRGAGYSALVLGALAVGLLAMQPGGLPLDEVLGGKPAMQGRREGACCSQLKLEIPTEASPGESTSPPTEATPDQLAGE